MSRTGRRQSYDGQLALLGLLLGQGGKALLEIFRQPIPSAPALHLGAVGAVIAAAAALTLVTLSRRLATCSASPRLRASL